MSGVPAAPPATAGLFATTPAGLAAHRAALEAAHACLAAAARPGPYSGASPRELAALAAQLELLPEAGMGLEGALASAGQLAVRHAVDPTHPACAAHLHCPPLLPALAGEVLAAACNQSLDSWDQAPAATHLELRLIELLAGEVGWDPATAGGTVTTGGTQSNLMGLLAARERAGAAGGGGVVLTSAAAHFSIERAALVLGLGAGAVERVATDGEGRLDPAALGRALRRLEDQGRAPLAVVATAGTTDLGAVDPLAEVAELARAHGAWLHVDAAYGGALLLSSRRALLAGIELADSVALDFHKLLWQPIACGAFLVREAASLAPLAVEVPYLNEPEPGGWAMPHLVSSSLATSRRFDALKLILSFQALGRRELAALLDRTLDLATRAAALLEAAGCFALAHRPALSTVAFRYRPQRDEPERSDRVNAGIRARLLARGEAVVGRARLGGRVHLKLTLLNPYVEEADLAALVELLARTGGELDEEVGRA